MDETAGDPGGGTTPDPAPWATPDAPSGGGLLSSPPSGSGGREDRHGGDPAPTTAAEPTTSGPPAPLIGALRPLTAGDALDGAFALLRTRPRAVIGTAALFVVPLQFLAAFLQRSLFGTGEVSEVVGDPSVTLLSSTSTSPAGSAGSFIVLVGTGLALCFICGTYAKLLGAWYAGSDLATGEAIKSTLRQAGPLLGGWFLVHLAVAPALCLGGAGIFLAPLYLVMAPVIAIEGVGPIDGIKRAWFVGTKRYLAGLLVAMGSGVAATLLIYALSLVPTVLVVFVGNELGWLVVAVCNSLASILGAVAVAGATALFYFDARVRLEGLDLVVATGAAFSRDR